MNSQPRDAGTVATSGAPPETARLPAPGATLKIQSLLTPKRTLGSELGLFRGNFLLTFANT